MPARAALLTIRCGHSVLFNDSVFYNIAYSKPGASEEEVHAAAKAAQIHDTIMNFPEQYDTSVVSFEFEHQS